MKPKIISTSSIDEIFYSSSIFFFGFTIQTLSTIESLFVK